MRVFVIGTLAWMIVGLVGEAMPAREEAPAVDRLDSLTQKHSAAPSLERGSEMRVGGKLQVADAARKPKKKKSSDDASDDD